MNTENTSYMAPEPYSRTARVWGDEAVERLTHARVAVFGIGGVGGHLCEALARAGVGRIDLIDRDTVSLSNLNRQIVALHSTVGRPKVDVMRERILDIAPDCHVTAHEMFYLPETADRIDLSVYDYVADAVDTVAAKLELITRCHALGVPLICAMGAGNKCHPEQFRVADITKTTTDPLARILRRELSRRGIRHQTVVFSDEQPLPVRKRDGDDRDGRAVPGSLPFVPGVMGMIMAGEILRHLIAEPTETIGLHTSNEKSETEKDEKGGHS